MLSRPGYVDTITILAGSDEVPFTVHKDVICAKSDFFIAACSGNWRENEDGVVRLPTVEARVVKLYIHWCYANKVEVAILNDSKVDDVADNNKDWCRLRTKVLIRSYAAANMLLDEMLMDAIMDGMIRLDSGDLLKLSHKSVQEVMENVGTGSELYALIVDCAGDSVRRDLLELFSQYPSRFLAEVAVRLREISGKDESM